MKTYKGASTNVNKGYKTHGSHKIVGQLGGQKQGNQGTVGNTGSHKGLKKAKEKLAKKDPVQARLRKISKSMFGQPKTTDGDISMRAQGNA